MDDSLSPCFAIVASKELGMSSLGNGQLGPPYRLSTTGNGRFGYESVTGTGENLMGICISPAESFTGDGASGAD